MPYERDKPLTKVGRKGRVLSSADLPSVERPKELRMLESAFPGAQADAGVEEIFFDTDNTGKVSVWDVETEASSVHYVGGDEDYRVDVARANDVDKRRSAVGRRVFEVIRIIRVA